MHRSFFAFERFFNGILRLLRCRCDNLCTVRQFPQKLTTAAHGSRVEGRLATAFSLR